MLPILKNLFWQTTWKHPTLGSITQAGLINNLNDGMVWGLLPILLVSKGFDLIQVGKIVAVYPMIWGISQLLTGKMGDHWNKKSMLFIGMFIQAISILFFLFSSEFIHFTISCIMLGIGTALVYPTFLAAIADATHPKQRAESIGIFRLWRDLGYAFGALLTGIISDTMGTTWAIIFVGTLTMISALIIVIRMDSRPPVARIDARLDGY